MKRLLFLLVSFVPFESWAQDKGVLVVEDQAGASVELYSQSHALLVGVSDYTAGWPDLESIPAELERVEVALEAHGFTVVKVMDPDGEALENAFKDFIDAYGYEQGNRLLFFFSGHGHTWRDEGRGYLVPTDAPLPADETAHPGARFLRKALPMSQVLAWTRELTARHALFLFDSCFSGTVFKTRAVPRRPSHITQATSLPVVQFITAGSAGETVPAKSVFTPAFVDALNFGLADVTEDGYITGVELGLYLTEKVPLHSRQSPQYGKHPDYELARGDFVFRVPRREPLPDIADKDCPECPAMVVVPGGSSVMGSPEDEVGRDADEGPQQRVSIRSFELSKHEVTKAEFARFVQGTGHETGPCYFYDGEWELDESRSWRDPGFDQTDDDPVVCVNWEDAQAYVSWLNGQIGRGYRLPTEAEWEYAARAGSRAARYWGEDPNEACDYANVADQAGKERFSEWTIHECRDGYVHTAPVGSFRANVFGVYDMLGNVWEWTEDCWNASYEGAPTNGSARATGDCSRRVVRGGSWLNIPIIVRSANRNRNATSIRGYDLGFRVARTLP